jgi:Transglycosylase SLT domain
MIGDLLSTAARAQKLDIASIQRGIQDGVIPSYIGIPLLQQKMKERSEAAQLLAGKQAQNQPPIAQQVMSEAQQVTQPQAMPAAPMGQPQQPAESAGIDQAQSNLPQTGFAGGGIVAFDEGGDVMQSMFDDEDPEDQDYVNAMMASMPDMNEGEDEMMAYAPESMASPTYNEMSYSRNSSSVKEPGRPEHGVAHEEISAKGKRGLEELLDLIKHKESRGRDYDEKGNPLTSPVGAKYAMQVMPATARDPGFGIKPAQNDSPEEFNRVGRQLYAAHLQKYGDPKLAAIAYNMGPGKTDKWLARGADMATLPQETRQYAQGFKEGGIAYLANGGGYSLDPATGEVVEDGVEPEGNFFSRMGKTFGYGSALNINPTDVIKKAQAQQAGVASLPTAKMPVTQSNLKGQSYSRTMGPGFNEGKATFTYPDIPYIHSQDELDAMAGASSQDLSQPIEVADNVANDQAQPAAEKDDQSGGLAALFSQQAAENKKERDINKYLALMSAGFGMMGGSSPYAFQNIGRGAQQGISTLADLNKDVDASDKALMAAQVQNAIAQQKYGQLDKFHQQALAAQKDRYAALDQRQRDMLSQQLGQKQNELAQKERDRHAALADKEQTRIQNQFAPALKAIESNQLLDDETRDKRSAEIRSQMDKAIMQSKTYRKHYMSAYGEDPYDIQVPDDISLLTQKHKSK